MAVIIGVDPHKASHTAVAIDDMDSAGRAAGALVGRPGRAVLVMGGPVGPERTWAVEGAGGLGYLLAQQLVSAGEAVLDVQPELGSARAAAGHRQRQQERPQRRPLGGHCRPTLQGLAPRRRQGPCRCRSSCGPSAAGTWAACAPRSPAGCIQSCATWSLGATPKRR